jgi:NADP-dependent aldehyde dehydrogenase
MAPQLIGKSIIGFERGTAASGAVYGIKASTGEELQPAYFAAGAEEVDRAVELAGKAFEIYRFTPGQKKASFLRKIAGNIEGIGEQLVTRATDETALPDARISAETVRTCYQLRLFADLVEEGSWVDARIDRADPTRQPLRKPDIRSMLRPLGPVAVFCASNFPLAFSVAGGDTASALAAGNPVIVKAHHAHPGTAELIGLAVIDAVRSSDLPEGLFSLLFGSGREIGTHLICHPLIKAGGFTGSRSGGQALMKLAANRPEPIPFHAEMSSVNPIFILPDAIREREEQIVTGLHASVTLGAGQFCTNPGLIFVPAGVGGSLIESLREKMVSTPSFTMLTREIATTYREGISVFEEHSAVERLDKCSPQPDSNASTAALFQTEAKSFLANPDLSAEVFGPSTLLVTYSNASELLTIVRGLEGQLTATVHATEAELSESGELLSALESKVGRIVFNGFPTGVEVCHSMVHGGPFPATSDGRSTSVGTRAALRFTRPVCYQDLPDSALPDELKNQNPVKIWRLVDGEFTRDPVPTTISND